MKLSAAQIKYLIAINKLAVNDSGVRSLDIAKALKVSKPSVHRILNDFIDLGLITKKHYSDVFLTELGKNLANLYLEKLSKVKKVLKGTLGIEAEETENGAMSLLGELEYETILGIK